MQKSALALTLTLLLACCSSEDHTLHGYEGYSLISERIDVSEYKAEEKVYKSVYVKDAQRLELIHLGEQGVLYDGTLE